MKFENSTSSLTTNLPINQHLYAIRHQSIKSCISIGSYLCFGAHRPEIIKVVCCSEAAQNYQRQPLSLCLPCALTGTLNVTSLPNTNTGTGTANALQAADCSETIAKPRLAMVSSELRLMTGCLLNVCLIFACQASAAKHNAKL